MDARSVPAAGDHYQEGAEEEGAEEQVSRNGRRWVAEVLDGAGELVRGVPSRSGRRRVAEVLARSIQCWMEADSITDWTKITVFVKDWKVK
jgi:hypothetical protein